MAMRRLLFTTAVLLAGCNAALAQVSTMGTTAMGLASTPGTIVTSPLNGPSPLSAMGGTTGMMPSVSAAPMISAVPASSSTPATGSTAAPFLTLSAQPATSSMSDYPGSTIPAPQPPAI